MLLHQGAMLTSEMRSKQRCGMSIHVRGGAREVSNPAWFDREWDSDLMHTVSKCRAE